MKIIALYTRKSHQLSPTFACVLNRTQPEPQTLPKNIIVDLVGRGQGSGRGPIVPSRKNPNKRPQCHKSQADKYYYRAFFLQLGFLNFLLPLETLHQPIQKLASDASDRQCQQRHREETAALHLSRFIISPPRLQFTPPTSPIGSRSKKTCRRSSRDPFYYFF